MFPSFQEEILIQHIRSFGVSCNLNFIAGITNSNTQKITLRIRMG